MRPGVAKVYPIRSRSSGALYEILLRTDGSWSCDCPSYIYGRTRRGDCKHIKAVQQDHVVAKQFDQEPSVLRMRHIEVA